MGRTSASMRNSKTASPRWRFDEPTFARTAKVFDNPDHVSIVIHNYRCRLGLAELADGGVQERDLAQRHVVDRTRNMPVGVCLGWRGPLVRIEWCQGRSRDDQDEEAGGRWCSFALCNWHGPARSMGLRKHVRGAEPGSSRSGRSVDRGWFDWRRVEWRRVDWRDVERRRVDGRDVERRRVDG